MNEINTKLDLIQNTLIVIQNQMNEFQKDTQKMSNHIDEVDYLLNFVKSKLFSIPSVQINTIENELD